MSRPWDFEEAVLASRTAANAQRNAEDACKAAAASLAEAERTYRMALAKRIVQAHADGVAWSVASDIARGDQMVADLRYSRDVAKGALDAAEQRSWRQAADRRDTLEFVRWSRNRELAEAA